MHRSFGRSPRVLSLVLAVALLPPAAATAQLNLDRFITGTVARQWQHWQDALAATLDRDRNEAEQAFGELLALDPSPLRLALFRDRTLRETRQGGALTMFEQDYAGGELTDAGREIFERLQRGIEQLDEADDAWYFASIGRFDVANANLEALLAQDPDPVAMLDFVDRVPRRHEILIQLTDHPIIGQAVRDVLQVLERGEELIKADPTRIKEHIRRLAGPPRMFENSVARLEESGEYAVPFIIQALQDPEKDNLVQPILRALPQIDRPALNPLVMALRMDNQTVTKYVIDAIADIGYIQAAPYLLRLIENEDQPEVLKSAARRALEELRGQALNISSDTSAAQAFYRLGEAYYDNVDVLAADPRLDFANVWYWRDNLLQNIRVPTEIFNEVMAMRCCEEALRLDPDFNDPLSLWLAANFRREAQLPDGERDATRPADFPDGSYFAQAAGAEYCSDVLARAVRDGDPAVALGAIEALRKIGGPASVTPDEQGRLPLAEALSFPDRTVRIQAALALGNANPTNEFQNYQNLMPVLAEALGLHAGTRTALVVDPDNESANAVAAILRGEGYRTVVAPELFTGLDQIRETEPSLDVLVLASDIVEPTLNEGLESLRSEFRFAFVPLVLIEKPENRAAAERLARGDFRVASVAENPAPDELRQAVATVSKAIGVEPITPDRGLQLALEAVQTLNLLAVTNNPVFNVNTVESALIDALGSDDPTLRLLVATVLGHICTTPAQEAIAQVALDERENEILRVEMFASLAEAAKRCGNQLNDSTVQTLIRVGSGDPNMTIRLAASRALGALNLPSNPASQIIRDTYAG